MLTKQMDYIIAIDIMGYEPIVVPAQNMLSKQATDNKRVVWTNPEKERFHFHPTTSAEHARKVVKKMLADGFEYRMYADGNQWLCSFSKNKTHHGASSEDTMAICRAALIAVTNEPISNEKNDEP